jgi:hypothetical protein
MTLILKKKEKKFWHDTWLLNNGKLIDIFGNELTKPVNKRSVILNNAWVLHDLDTIVPNSILRVRAFEVPTNDNGDDFFLFLC